MFAFGKHKANDSFGAWSANVQGRALCPSATNAEAFGKHQTVGPFGLRMATGPAPAKHLECQCVLTLKCKLFLPKFNTWRLVLLELKNG